MRNSTVFRQKKRWRIFRGYQVLVSLPCYIFFSRTLCNIRKRCKYCKTLLVDTSEVIGKHNFLILLWSNLIGGIISFPIASCHRGSKTYHSWTAWNSALYNNIIIHLRNCKKKKIYVFIWSTGFISLNFRAIHIFLPFLDFNSVNCTKNQHTFIL